MNLVEFLIILLGLSAAGVVIHELGHAIAALMLTKSMVSVYLGTDQADKSHIKLEVLRLKFYIRIGLNIFVKSDTQYSVSKLSKTSKIIILLSGPILQISYALFIMNILIYKFEAFDYSYFLNILGITICLSYHFGAIPNLGLKPNDGHKIYHLLKVRKEQELYYKFSIHYENKAYLNLIKLFPKIRKKYSNKNIESYIKCTFEAYSQINDHAGLLAFYKNNNFEIGANECLILANSCSVLNLHHDAIYWYQKAETYHKMTFPTAEHVAYEYLQLKEYMEAIIYYDKAIKMNPNRYDIYNNRGLAKLEMNLNDEALLDFHQSIKLNKNNPQAYCNFGKYHMKMKNYTQALEYFNYAQELDPKMIILKDLIATAKNYIQ